MAVHNTPNVVVFVYLTVLDLLDLWTYYCEVLKHSTLFSKVLVQNTLNLFEMYWTDLLAVICYINYQISKNI